MIDSQPLTLLNTGLLFGAASLAGGLNAVAASLGGYLTAHYARKLDPQWIRKFVIVVAFTMTAYFFIHG
jgi:uncharacterized membrane protein YfcA